MPENQMNNHESFASDGPLESGMLGKEPVVRDRDGIWRYKKTWVAVPGAKDMTLTNYFGPKFVVNGNEEIERVVVSGSDVESFPDLLGWCLQEGTPIVENGEVVEVLVPYELWQERDRVPGELSAPEYYGDKAEQDLAKAERHYREAELKFETAAGKRAHALRRHADEMTRQRAREITGLSVGRIQQLIRAEILDEEERRVLEIFEPGPILTFEEFKGLAAEAGLDPENVASVTAGMESRGFIALAPEGMALTAEGNQALAETRLAEQAGAEAG